MPDLLISARDDKSYFELEKLGTTRGFRVKSVIGKQKALEWLKLRDFDAFFIDASTPIEEQQELAGALWQKNPLAQFVVFDLDETHKVDRNRGRLFGAEVAHGPQAMRTLEECLDRVKPRGSLRAESFKILVVEDLDSPRDIICAFLEGIGFPLVTGVQSVNEAMKELQKNPQEYSCVLTDIKMPQISGATLIKLIREHKDLNRLPIIVLTAYGTADCLVDCLRAGASGFLVKPPKKDDLSRELGRALRIVSHGGDPRLINPQDAESVRGLLEEKGLV